ncbi:MAG: diadenylate cyclase [Planctomycetota bacterium]|nr:diadenylate cyclase [Planctomycetota bacterium]
MDTLGWSLQILILTLGIYLFLRFLRTTQGGRIVRGLAIGVPVIIVTIWGTATYLQLAELQFILQNVGGYAVVFIAILFQDELRRGMAQFGENPLVNRFVTSFETDVLKEVSGAAVAMATKQESHGSFTRIKPHGALIVFERESSLKSYIDGGRRVDAVVSRDFLESVFQPKSPLHDGAVVIRKDRVAAVSCMLPLTQNLSIAKTTGTRHRAAIGLTEETDAVTLVVSEETGKISIATAGELRQVSQADLEAELRKSLGANIRDKRTPMAERMAKFMREDLAWFAGSILLALSILFIAQGSISEPRRFNLTVVEAFAGDTAPPQPGTLTVVLPGPRYHLTSPDSTRSFSVVATGPIGQLDALGTGLIGTISLSEDGSLESTVDIDEVHWGTTPPIGVELEFEGGDAPRLEAVRYGTMSITLVQEHVDVDSSALDPHFELAEDPASFDVSSVEITAPPSVIAELKEDPSRFKLESISLTATDYSDRVVNLRLHDDLTSRDCSLLHGIPIATTVAISPVANTLTTLIDKEITLSFFNEVDRPRLEHWKLKGSQLDVSFRIVTRGILPTGVDTAVYEGEEREILKYVRENLRVYVDIAAQPEAEADEGARIPIEWLFKDPDWRGHLDKLGPAFDRASLEVELTSDEPTVSLERIPTTPGE